MSQVFISHAKEDRPIIESCLLGLLKALHFDIWLAEDEIHTTEHWQRSIVTGMQSSDWFILVMSPKSARSEWVKDEVNWAIENRSQRIIPILLADCNPLDFHIHLPGIQHLDFRNNVEFARERLISVLVRAEYKTDSLANIVNGLMACPSKEILTVIKTVTDGTGQQASIVGANERAEEFYGRKKGITITGTDVANIFKVLSQWINVDDFDALHTEQVLIYDKIRRGEEIFATIPIKINGNHPVPAFRGRNFLPITIAYSKPEIVDRSRVEYHVVMYLDLGTVGGVSKTSPTA